MTSTRLNKIKKNLILIFIVTFLGFNQTFSSEKQEKENLNSWLGAIGSSEIQELVCKYIDKWDEKTKEIDVNFNEIQSISNPSTPDGKLLPCLFNNSLKLLDISNIANIRYNNDLDIAITMRIGITPPISFDVSQNDKYIAITYLIIPNFSTRIPNKDSVLKDYDGSILEIYDISDGKIKSKNSMNFLLPIRWIKFLNKNFLLVINEKIRSILDISNFDKIFTAQTFETHNCYDSQFILSRNNHYLLEFDSSARNIIWDCKSLPDLKEITNFAGHFFIDHHRNLALTDDNKKFASLDFDKVKIWDIENISNLNLKCIFEDDQKQSNIGNISLAYNPNNKYLACTQSNSTIKIYDTKDYNKIQTYVIGQACNEPENGLIHVISGSLIFTNDGTAIIFASNDGRLNIATNLAMLLKTKNALNFDHYCNFCNKTKNEISKLSRCSRCRSVRYCNADCQRKDWQNHKDNCK